MVRLLDGYTRDWARQHTEACEATGVRGVQTEELLSLTEALRQTEAAPGPGLFL